MFVLVLAAEADETRQAVTLLIVCLVGIAIMLAALTVWYWLFTSPKRRADRLLADLGHYAPESEQMVDEIDVAVDAREEIDARVEIDTAAVAGDADVDLAVASVGAGNRTAIDLAGLASPTILSESSELMSSMLDNPDEPTSPRTAERPIFDVDVDVGRAADDESAEPFRRVIPSKRTGPADRPDLRVSGAPKTVRSSDPKPAEAPAAKRGAKRLDPAAAARPTVAKPVPTSTPAPESSPKPTPKQPGPARIEVAARPSVRSPEPQADNVGSARPAPPQRKAETTQDELAKLRQRRARQRQDQEGLSDDDWASVMKSAFDHLNR